MSASPSHPNRNSERLITTVIPSFEGAPTIERAVTSALAQNGGRIEVIVVVDGACDETQGILEDFGDPRVKILVNERSVGAPASRNRGLAEVTTPYVSFLDSDDYVEGDLLGPLLERMQSERAQLGFGPSIHLNWGEPRRLEPDFRDHEDVFVRWFSGIQNVQTASVGWSTDYLRGIGGWDESIRRNQDGELALRAILLGARFTCSFEGAGVWVNNDSSARITRRTDNLGALIDVIAKFEKMHSEVVSDSARLGACAAQLRRVAKVSYRAGELAVAAEAVAYLRRLGFAQPRVDLERLMAIAMQPLPARHRRAAWVFAHQVRKTLAPRRDSPVTR